MTAILEFDDVVKSYGSGTTEVRALRGVSLAVEAGEFVAVMGPSGCGKSTLLHLAGALETPSAGSIRVAGQELAGLDAAGRGRLRRHDVGFVFQRLNLIPALSAIENVMLPLELEGEPSRSARRLGDRIARSDGSGRDSSIVTPTTSRADSSSGSRSRARSSVSAACCSPTNRPVPSIPRAATRSSSSSPQLPGRHGTAVVLVTHEPRFASWADRVVFLRDGRIVDETPAIARPRDDRDRGATPLADGRSARSHRTARQQLARRDPPRATGGPTTLGSHVARDDPRRRAGARHDRRHDARAHDEEPAAHDFAREFGQANLAATGPGVDARRRMAGRHARRAWPRDRFDGARRRQHRAPRQGDRSRSRQPGAARRGVAARRPVPPDRG